MEVLFWFVGSLCIGFAGQHRTLGFGKSFGIALLFSPLVGLIAVLISNHKPVERLSTIKEIDLRKPPLANVPVSSPVVVSEKSIDPIQYKETEVSVKFDFVAFDFETANKSYDSACALGVAVVKDGRIVETRHWLIRPPSSYFEFTHIHGITWQMVTGAGTFADVWHEIHPYLAEKMLVAHNAEGFDKRVLLALLRLYNISFEPLVFVDTLKMARERLTLPNYRLNTLCAHFGIDLTPHHAESDAVACATLLLRLLDFEEPTVTAKVVLSHAPTAPLSTLLQGKRVVFTGDIEGYSRAEIKALAESHGATVTSAVSKKTDYVVRGGTVSSSKLNRAYEVQEQGGHVEIVTVSTFFNIIAGRGRKKSDLKRAV
jgi:DNA polymerase-3 subunit epsilon